MFRAGNFIQATRVSHDDDSPHPPTMVAAMMRPGAPSSMNVNDFHNSLGHANVKALYETAKQMGIKLTGIREYCDGCAVAKAIKRAVPKVVDSSRKSSRPFQRIFMDLAGGYPKSTGSAKYLTQLVDDYTNFGWTVFVGDKSGPTVVGAFRTWCASVKHLISVHGEVGCVLTDNGTEWVNEDFRTMLVDLGIARELTAVDGSKSNGRVERRIALVSEGAKAAFVVFPSQFPDITFPARTNSYAAIWPEAFTWMNDCLNITAAVHKNDKQCPEEKLYGKRRVKQAWPFMVPGFRHRNRPTKMHDKGERCFHLNSGNDHSSNTHKVITPAGIATYSAHCTFGYRRQAFQGEVPTWGGGAITSSRSWPTTASSPGAALDPLAAATSSRGGDFPAATPAALAAPRGGGIPPMSSSGAAATSATAATSSHGGGIPAAVPTATTSAAAATTSRGGGIPAAVPAATTSAAAATSSRGGGIPAAVPAAEVTGGTHVSGSGVRPPAVVGAVPTPPASDPSVAAGTATGELLATGKKQLVTSGGRGEGLAEVSRMAGGNSPVGPGASGPPDMVHDGGAGGRWRGHRVTPAVTRSRAKRDGLWPGMFALMAIQEDITRSIAELPPPDVVEQELPSELACNMETPETYVQAHTGPHSDIWTKTEGKELRCLNATGAFEAAGSE